MPSLPPLPTIVERNTLNNFTNAPGPSSRNCTRRLRNVSTNNLGNNATESAFVPGKQNQISISSYYVC